MGTQFHYVFLLLSARRMDESDQYKLTGVIIQKYRLIHEQSRCITECLHWDLTFFMSFSAYEPGEFMTQKDVLKQLKQDCSTITNQH